MTRPGDDPHTEAERPRTEQEIARDLRLRPDPPRVMRLSRRAITGAAILVGLGLGAILIVALQDNRRAETTTELFSTDHIQTADGLSQLPRDYGDIPRLGPPLPGELGRPILSARERGLPVPAPPVSGPALPAADPEEQRRLQEIEAARVSALFAEAQTTPRDGAALPAPGALQNRPSFPAQETGRRASDAAASQEAFLNRAADTETVSAARLTAPPSPYILQAGTVIPAALITGLRSDLPGRITAQVTSNVYDSPSGRYLLIPQGARLLGDYDSRIAVGQNRLLLVWTRLILPDGRSILLAREPGTDGAGTAGLRDRVNHRWGRVFLAAGLATLLNLGLESGAENEDDVAGAIRDAARDTIGRTGDEIVRQQIALPPTLTVRPGFPVRVMVTRDLILEPLGEVQ
ncbi:TrbI/VirB10 family protein [Ruegeria sp. HKCCD8929]|uniref:TrbI/VirB10 family protein n=1 Tax=Ruegeria sp. HKCCD8929 TaxID=2683006 RepID=UPI0020C5AEFC|nr:TrbI/VirB10 family protein [Ruegeria sp. HKCCD8929]